ncbi:S1 RNA-binding domain-containing protein [Fusibacter sp. A1]|uniref:S1 RNA-binding domain-containing protein n=2 Tax=unclassified Fusibacter TaxID=2624464 RepID=UPI0013E95786|nr:S1 RNA-binding domain-containing protein [Fusibacter sp. A1]MCK8061000.1 S1 RNA-binding domain-containing protein [Fusibacter sp. A2]NPE20546.1 S1 RNA-binding domain-containing protein [Fusibacter sp. A1]
MERNELELEQPVVEKEEVEVEDVEEEIEETMEDFMDQINDSFKDLRRGDLVDARIIQVLGDSIITDISYVQDGVVYEQELVKKASEYKENETLKLIIIDFSKEGQVVLSETKAQRQFGQAILEDAVANNSTFEGEILKTAKGGFRISVSGVEGYLPFSLYQSRYLENPEELVGTKTLLKVEKNDNRGYVFTRLPIEKEIYDKVKRDFYQAHQKGDVVEGRLEGFNRGGVVVNVDGMRGFIPRSEVSYSRETKAEDLISEGDVLKLVIRELSERDEKLILSLKDLIEDPWSRIDEEVAVGDVFEVYPNGENQNFYFYELVEGIQGSLFKKDLPVEVKGTENAHVLEVVSIDKERKRIELSYYFEVDAYEEEEADEENSNSIGNLFGDALKGLKFD